MSSRLPEAEASAAFAIMTADLDDPRLIALLRHHKAEAASHTEPGSAHALDVNGLRQAEVSVWTVWDGETLAGVGALKRLSATHGEVKSMHVVSAYRRRRAGSLILRHIVDAGRGLGLTRLSLETGSWPFFAPAWALYRRHGFVECGPFADYRPDPNSLFFTLEPL